MPQVEKKPAAFHDVLHSRRSIRRYTDTPVEADAVRALLDAAVQAPTAIHAEPWLFVVVQDRAALKRYSDLAKQALLERGHASRGLHDPLALGSESEFMKALARGDFNIFYNASTLILIACRPLNPFVTADCWLAAENLMLEATALGLGTCCIGSAIAALNTADVKAELGIPSDVTVIVAITVGMPAETGFGGARKAPVILTWKRSGSADQSPPRHADAIWSS